MAVSGSGRNITLNGIPFEIAADANPGRQPTQENDGVVHSGGVEKKVTLVMGSIESAKLIISDVEYEILEGLSEQAANFPMSHEKADGTVLSATGFIGLDNYEAEENSCEITMTSETRKWTTFSP